MEQIQQLTQNIELLKSEIENLKNSLNQLQFQINNKNNLKFKLDSEIDPSTKDIINRIFRDNYRQTLITVTAGFTIPVQSEFIKISAAGAVTSSLTTAISNGFWYGQILVLEGTDNVNTITIKNTANTKLSADCVLGIYDSLTLIWEGTYWMELARSNN